MFKEEIRERIWRILEEEGVARFPRPVHGRIPNFEGAEIAGRRITELDEFKKAYVVKVSPDSPQYIIRLTCLKHGKTLIMPTPRLKEGFLLLDPSRIPEKYYDKAATIRGAFTFGEKIDPVKLPEIDFITVGSVAVGRDGSRIGKGEGYSELEYAILREYGKIDEKVLVTTNVHDLQVLENLPQDPFDVPVDIIATPSRLIRVTEKRPKPTGIIWSMLDDDKLREIPLLRSMKSRGRL
ncbi:MAG: 5-formyltetrahydrofolate cyclo-ligase [Candidatus Caldarchaeales archaeon]